MAVRVTLEKNTAWPCSRTLRVWARPGQGLTITPMSISAKDDIPESDACMARLLARAFGSYDTDGFVENAERWRYLSELTTDNFGWFAEGAGFLSTFYHP